MLQRRASHHGKRHAESHAVVGTQRCAAGFHPSVVNVSLDRVGEGIEFLAFIGHTDHVHMGMKHGDGCLFVSRSAGFADKHTVVGIALVIQLMTLGKLAEPVGHSFFVPRRAGNLVQFLE